MLRRASFALGLALMGWAVFVIRAAHVSAVACTGTDVTKAHTILAGSCTGVTWPYLQGFALLIGGAFIIIFGLALGSARAGQERKVERQFRRDLKAGKYDNDPTAVVTEATIRERISMHRGYQVTPESAPIPYEQRFLKPFDDASPTLGEDAATEVAQTDGEKDREEGQ